MKEGRKGCSLWPLLLPNFVFKGEGCPWSSGFTQGGLSEEGERMCWK